MIAIQVSHADMNARTFHFDAATFTTAEAKRKCREWALENGYYGATVRKA